MSNLNQQPACEASALPIAVSNGRPRAQLTNALLIVLAFLGSMAPFATDLYLPAFPMMVQELATSAAGVQITLTAFLIGTALGQLLFGPLSDRFGRVPPILFGSIVCAIASAGAALAPTIPLLVVARFIQGLAASAGMVVGRAIILDLAATPAEATRGFNIKMTVLGIAPVIAPWIGSLIVGTIGWRGALWVVFSLAVTAVALVCAFVRESRPPREPGSGSGLNLRTLWSRPFLGYTFSFGLAFSTLIAYISASPFLFQTIIGLSVVQYGLLFATITVLLTATGMASAHLAAKFSARRLLRFGLYGLTGASLALAAIVLPGGPPSWTIAPIAIAVASLGFIMGNATSVAIASVPRAVGAGSAVLGALQFAFGALVAPLVGAAGARSAIPLALVMLVAAVTSLGAFLIAERGQPAVR